MRDLIGWSSIALSVAGLMWLIWPPGRQKGRHRRPSVPLNVVQAPRQPDPYVWRNPDPYQERWRRWARRVRAAIWHGKGTVPPLIPDEPVWSHATHPRATWEDPAPPRAPRATWAPPDPFERAARRQLPFEDQGALVRPYVEHLTRERRRT